jgi:rhodanese-related sulfurtransferase
MGEIPTEVTVYVICKSGGRSAKAVEHLRANGVDAVNVAGGTLAWIEAGNAVETGG